MTEKEKMMLCKIKCIKYLEGVFPELQPEIGKVYDAEYFCPRYKTAETAVVEIKGKRIIMRRGEFELVDGENGFYKERMRITCCKDCSDRFPGCHGQCERYKGQRAEYDAQKAEYMKKHEVQQRLTEQVIDTIYKTTKHVNYRKKHR